MSATPMPTPRTFQRGLDHRTVWRWHFYAGLFCVPFVLWLAATGTIYLFKPQIEAFMDRQYDNLRLTQSAPVAAQVHAAIKAVPGSALDQYQFPRKPTASAQVLVDKGIEQFRVYVQPQTLQVLHIDNEDKRLEKIVFKLHGEMLMGKYGSWIIELAGSWAVLMIVSGLFLWWPRNVHGLGGILYPRLTVGGRTFWKDIHAVTGIYISFFALFLLFSGLPWAKSWGAYLKAARQIGGEHYVKQDWLVSSADEEAARAATSSGAAAASPSNGPAPGMSAMTNMAGMSPSEHAEHGGHRQAKGLVDYTPIDRVAATVAPLGLAYPVLIAPPTRTGGVWSAKSDAQDRPLRVDLTVDPMTGGILSRKDFRSKPWLDRVVGTGIAAHEGQLFGWLNQLVSLLTATGLALLSVSGLIMWWKRRPVGVLGAPAPICRVPFSFTLAVLVIAFGIYMPFLGGSMLLVFFAERFILRRIPPVRTWLGLSAPRSAVRV